MSFLQSVQKVKEILNQLNWFDIAILGTVIPWGVFIIALIICFVYAEGGI